MTISSTLSNEAITSIITQLGMNTDGISSVVTILSALAAVLFFVVVFCVAISLGCIKVMRIKYNETEPHASSNVDVTEQSIGEHDYDYTDLSSSQSGHKLDNIIYANSLMGASAPSVPPEKYPVNALDSNMDTNDTYYMSLDSTGLDKEPVYAPLYDVLSSNEINVPLFKPKNFKLLRTLGMGYFGKVLLAETVNINWEEFNFTATEYYTSRSTKVAVKKLKANCSASIKVAFHKELKFMSRLQHENVVRVLGACLQEEAFIVMEYVKNGALNGFLQNYEDISLADDPTTDLAINIHILIKMSSQIANGMKYLSSKNYIHRDLAARNILVGEEFKVKISDFGMSRNLYTSHYYIMQGRTAVPIRWMARDSLEHNALLSRNCCRIFAVATPT